MFNNNSNDQHANTDIDQVAKDIDQSDSQHIGIGANPSTFTPVMPAQAQSAPPPTDDVAVETAVEPVSLAQPADTTTQAHANASNNIPADLADIKEEALKQLSPLVGKLEQPAEEKFRTIMMMIQASDNHDLIRDAYEAANRIEDEEVKAQALLSVVNEINYFTQKHST